MARGDGRRNDGEWSLISARGVEAIKNKDDEFAAKMLPVADAIRARGLTTLLRSKTSRGADEWTPTAVRNLLLRRPTKGPVQYAAMAALVEGAVDMAVVGRVSDFLYDRLQRVRGSHTPP